MYKTTPISEELIKDGFAPFDPYSRGDRSNPHLSEVDGLFAESPPAKKKRTIENVLVDDCVNWLSDNRNSTIKISNVLKPFAAKEVFKYLVEVLPQFKANNTFALLGLSVPTKDSQGAKLKQIEGTVLMEWHKSPTFDLARDIRKLQTLLEKNLGLSQEDIYRRGDFLKTQSVKNVHYLKGNRLHSNKNKFKHYTQEESRQIHDAHEQMTRRGDGVVKVVNVSEFELDSNGLDINLIDNLCLSKVNSVAVLMGSGPKSLMLREVLTEEIMEKCRKEEVFSNWQDQLVITYSNKKLGVRMFDFYLYFTNGYKLCHLYPLVKENFDACREVMIQLSMLKVSVETKKNLKMCPYCGKKEDEFIRDITGHKSRCRLEHQGCDCKITFKTPSEKRRHMKLFHSGKKYHECKECSFITMSPKSLENHITFNHGNPGQEEACDLCDKTFKATNYLRIHRFNHECYFCDICNIEIRGRNSHKSHKMKVHKAGFECDQCSKKIYTEKELEVHKKEEHSQIWKT